MVQMLIEAAEYLDRRERGKVYIYIVSLLLLLLFSFFSFSD